MSRQNLYDSQGGLVESDVEIPDENPTLVVYHRRTFLYYRRLEQYREVKFVLVKKAEVETA